MKTLKQIHKMHYRRRIYVVENGLIKRTTLYAFTHTLVRELEDGSYIFKDQALKKHPLKDEADYIRLLDIALGTQGNREAVCLTKAEAVKYQRKFCREARELLKRHIFL
jgi:hypothetical protein